MQHFPSHPSGFLFDLFHTIVKNIQKLKKQNQTNEQTKTTTKNNKNNKKKNLIFSGCDRVSFKLLQPPKHLPVFPGYRPTRLSFWSLLSASEASQFGCPDLNPFSSFSPYPVSDTKWSGSQSNSSPQERIVSPFNSLSHSLGSFCLNSKLDVSFRRNQNLCSC